MADSEAQNLDGPWPELVGISAQDAEQILRALRPDLTIQLVHQGDMVTMDFREDRVRIFYNDAGVTARAPKLG